MSNLLTFTDKAGKEVQFTQGELRTVRGRAWIEEQLGRKLQEEVKSEVVAVVLVDSELAKQ